MIIDSLLQNDLYKYTMAQVALHQFSDVQVQYEFKCRNKANWTERHLLRIKEEVYGYCSLSHTKDELDYLRSISFFKPSFIDFLKLYRPDPDHFDIRLVEGELKINIRGPWFLCVFYEVPLLSIVNEVYFESNQYEAEQYKREGYVRLDRKLEINNKTPFKFIDFGTRRRYSRQWHRDVVEYLKKHCPNFVGTSNIAWAKEFDIKPIGTHAHEYFQIGQGLSNVALVSHQKHMLQCWAEEYRGELGIALTDIIGIDAFLRDFDLYFAKLFDGVRHDSGCPYTWANKVINHYKKLGIDPKYKTLVFSDGLDFENAAALHDTYKEKTNVSFGIGTSLTNDVGLEPLQIVIKLVEVNNRPVAKISDSPGKGMCRDENFVSYLKGVFNR